MIGMTNVVRRKQQPVVTFNGLTFTAPEGFAGISYYLTGYSSGNEPILYYSYDAVNWSSWAADDILYLDEPDRLFVKGDNPNGLCQSQNVYVRFIIDYGAVNASGNINSLLDNGDGSTITEIPNDYCFNELFSGCYLLMTMPDLPATILKEGCYLDMFFDTGLTDLSNKVLPATIIPNYAYNSMFSVSTITHAPNMLFSSIASGARYALANMFADSYNLTYIKLENYTGALNAFVGFSNWVSGVSGNGTIYYKGSTTSQGDSAIPSGWTKVSSW